MKVLDLLDEIVEIVDTASGFPLTGKIMVDSEELLELVREIKAELPDEFEEAKWITNEKQEILSNAKNEYESVISDARRQAAELVDKNDITEKARIRAKEIYADTQEEVNNLTMDTYKYMASLLENFQQKMEELNVVYFENMFKNIGGTFDEINSKLDANISEIKEMAFDLSREMSDSEDEIIE